MQRLRKMILEVRHSIPPVLVGVTLVFGLVWLTLSLFGAPYPFILAVVATATGSAICLKAEIVGTAAVPANQRKLGFTLWLERHKREALIASAPRYSTELFRSKPSAMFLEMPKAFRQRLFPQVPTAQEAEQARHELAHAYAGGDVVPTNQRHTRYIIAPGAEA